MENTLDMSTRLECLLLVDIERAGNFKFMPKGDINEATLVFYTTDTKGNIKRENLNHEAYKQRKKREAKAEGLKR